MRRLPLIAVLLSTALFGCAKAPETVPAAAPTPPPAAKIVHTGLFYYTWYRPDYPDGHWVDGYSNDPLLGEYRSDMVDVAEAHHAMLEHGETPTENIFLVEYVGHDLPPTVWFQRGWMVAPTSIAKNAKFALVYDLFVRMWHHYKITPAVGYDLNNADIRWRITDDLVRALNAFGSHRRYVRIAGKPVIYFYLSREMRGPLRSFMAELRDELYRQTGLRPYFIGDEVTWQTIDQPEAFQERAKAFDAVTCFSCYDLIHAQQAAGDAERYAQELTGRLFPQILDFIAPLISDRGRPIAFVPSVFPQYDDRNVREGNAPLFLTRYEHQFLGMLRRAARFATPLYPEDWGMLTIYSFNEWLEGTSIEATRRDAVDARGHLQYRDSLLAALFRYHVEPSQARKTARR